MNNTKVEFVINEIVVDEALTVNYTVDGEVKSKTYAIADTDKAEQVREYFRYSNKEYFFNDIKDFASKGFVIDTKSLKDIILADKDDTPSADDL